MSRKKLPALSDIQSIAFDRNIWSPLEMKRWLHAAKYKPYKFHVTRNYVRFRMTDPSLYSRFKAVKKRDGILITYGYY